MPCPRPERQANGSACPPSVASLLTFCELDPYEIGGDWIDILMLAITPESNCKLPCSTAGSDRLDLLTHSQNAILWNKNANFAF